LGFFVFLSEVFGHPPEMQHKLEEDVENTQNKQLHLYMIIL